MVALDLKKVQIDLEISDAVPDIFTSTVPFKKYMLLSLIFSTQIRNRFTLVRMNTFQNGIAR